MRSSVEEARPDRGVHSVRTGLECCSQGPSGSERGVDIAAWLTQLGLERYEPAFRDAEVTGDVLADLGEADLEKLGLPLGPRKKLLRAIADFVAKDLADPAHGGVSPQPTIP